MRLFFAGLMAMAGAVLALLGGGVSWARHATLEASIIGYLHVECTQYQACNWEPRVHYVSADGRLHFDSYPNPYDELFISWNPAGTDFAFTADATGNLPRRSIFISSFNGAALRPLIQSPTCHYDYPVWSPDGAWIAYVQSCGRSQQLGLTRPDGSEKRILLRNLDLVGAPAWFPDSRSLLMSITDRSGNHDLFRVNTQRGSLQQLSDTPEHESKPVVAPDGQHIALHSWVDFEQWIHVLDIETGEQRLISSRATYSLAPQWSPDGAWLYYIDRNRQSALIRVRPDGTESTLITPNAWEPRTAPTGDYVLFMRDVTQLHVYNIHEETSHALPSPPGNSYQAEWVRIPQEDFDARVWGISALILAVLGLAGLKRWRFSV